MSRSLATVGTCVVCLSVFPGCSRDKSEAKPALAKSAVVAPTKASSTASAPTAPPQQPTRLLTLPISAYRPALRLADNDVYLLTDHAAYRLGANGATEKFDLELGVGATLTPSSFVYWSNGAVQRAPRSGSKPERWLALPDTPQYFVSSGEHVAWLAHANDGTFSIQVPAGKRARTLYTSTGVITALVMLQDHAFFVESSDSTWRVGAVGESGEPKYARIKTGRPPSMLTTADRQIFYYDGERFEIVRLATDLQSEEEWVRDVICSPIAVAGGAYCGSVEGLYKVSHDEPQPRMLSINNRTMIATVMADASHVVWVRDIGPDRLAVEMLNVGAH